VWLLAAVKWKSVECEEPTIGGVAVTIAVAAGESVGGRVSLWCILEDGMERKGESWKRQRGEQRLKRHDELTSKHSRLPLVGSKTSLKGSRRWQLPSGNLSMKLCVGSEK
jgi:hypothetical protein